MMNHITLKAHQKKDIAKAFGKAAHTYDQNAVLQKEIGQRLLERLDFFKTEPNTILDLGSGTGYFTEELQRLYPEATCVGLDISEEMLAKAKERSKNILCADAEYLPLKDESIDLVFSNCTFQWCGNYSALFEDIHRALTNQGLLLFSTFGPDTLQELRESFKRIDDKTHVNNFLDMHLLGDALLQANFHAPVVDREIITVTYENVLDLLKDLKGMGANYIISEDSPRETKVAGLRSAQSIQQLDAAYEIFRQGNTSLPATFEVIYGYALKAQGS